MKIALKQFTSLSFMAIYSNTLFIQTMFSINFLEEYTSPRSRSWLVWASQSVRASSCRRFRSWRNSLACFFSFHFPIEELALSPWSVVGWVCHPRLAFVFLVSCSSCHLTTRVCVLSVSVVSRINFTFSTVDTKCSHWAGGWELGGGLRGDPFAIAAF